MMRPVHWMAALLRTIIRALMTRRQRIGALEKFVRAAPLVPVFGSLLIILRIRAALRGPLRVPAISEGGDRFMCDLPDLIPLYIYLFGVWEPDLAAYIRGRLRPGDAFIDVGANIGFDALLAARAVGERGRVVAIEAAPAVHQRLCETLRNNPHGSIVRAINMAVAKTAGTLDLYAGPAHNLGLTTTAPRGAMPHIASVDAAPLAQLLSIDEIERARLIKIDVEGGEPAVLAGMLPLLDRLPHEIEIAVELSPLWWPASGDGLRATAADVLQPFFDRAFHAYTIPNNYWPWRYLWPRAVRRPRRLRDAALLRRPVKRLDVILSRRDVEEL